MSQQRPNARRTSKRSTVAMGEQKQVSEQSEPSSLQSLRPPRDDHAAWFAYWQKQDQSWRTEPEIRPERQAELEKCRALVPDVEKGLYPFKGMKLGRADVEWLLATHEGGPIKWSDEKERVREGLDVRGADLQLADLHQLPLTRLRGGLTYYEWLKATEKQRSSAAVLMRGADLREAQLEGADLTRAQLEGADLREAQLEGADLFGAQLEGAYLREAQLKGAYLREAQLKGADLEEAQLKGAQLFRAQLEGANLVGAQLERAYLVGAKLEGAYFTRAQLKGANLSEAQLEGANLSEAQLEGANLSEAQLEGADLRGAQLEGADLRGAQLEGANLVEAQLEGANLVEAQLERTVLRNVMIGDKQRIGPRLADLRWGETNLAVVDWSQVAVLGDEREARQKKTSEGRKKGKAMRLSEYQAAVRANRQLAVALQAQGLNEEAAHFAYRAQVLQREVWRRQHRYLKYVGSWLLWLLAGHGYRPLRSLLWYLAIIFVFATAYYVFGHLSLWPPDAFVYSLTSFHGRGFFPGLERKHSLHDPLIMLAAFEAVVGLFIEISFIATFTQRFFGK